MPPSKETSPATRRVRGLWRQALVATAVVAGAGCYINNAGQAPALDALYFPTGLLTSPGRTSLYVTNSDFDLQFNGGTVMALNLPRLREKILKPLLSGL